MRHNEKCTRVSLRSLQWTSPLKAWRLWWPFSLSGVVLTLFAIMYLMWVLWFFSLICILKSFVVKHTKCWAQRDTNIVPNCVQISPQGEWGSAGGLQKGVRTPIFGCIQGLRNWQIGNNQHKGQILKVAQVDSWLLIVTGDKLIEELRSAPEHVLSEENAMADVSV